MTLHILSLCCRPPPSLPSIQFNKLGLQHVLSTVLPEAKELKVHGGGSSTKSKAQLFSTNQT